MSNVQTRQQPLPAGGVACPHCGDTTILSQEELRRVAAKYVAKHGTATLARVLGARPAVRSAVANSSGLPTPPASPRTQATRPTPPAPQISPAPRTPPTPQNSQLREDGIWKLDRLLGPRRLRGTGAAHWLRSGIGGRNPLHAGRLAARSKRASARPPRTDGFRMQRKVMGSGNIKQRGRTRLAWRVGGGRHLDSLLIRG